MFTATTQSAIRTTASAAGSIASVQCGRDSTQRVDSMSTIWSDASPGKPGL